MPCESPRRLEFTGPNKYFMLIYNFGGGRIGAKLKNKKRRLTGKLMVSKLLENTALASDYLRS